MSGKLSHSNKKIVVVIIISGSLVETTRDFKIIRYTIHHLVCHYSKMKQKKEMDRKNKKGLELLSLSIRGGAP